MDFTRCLTLPAFAGMTPQLVRKIGVFLLAAAAHFATVKAWIPAFAGMTPQPVRKIGVLFWRQPPTSPL